MVVKGYMGQLGQDVNPHAREAAGWIVVAQNYLTLLFSAVASVPDFAGALIRTRELQPAIRAARTARSHMARPPRTPTASSRWSSRHCPIVR